MTRISTGFVGVGDQGGPIALRMLEGGYPLTVFARRSEVAHDYAAKGAALADTVAALGVQCDHVGVCVVNDAQVLDVCAQLIAAMRAGSVLAIHSTILPETCEQLERECAARGVLLLDAPVSGGRVIAAQGALTVMCGGSEEAFAKALPVLETFGKLIVRLGGAGAGQRAKIVNNALLSANMGAAWAALESAEVLGVDRAAFREIIAQSSGRSLGFEIVSHMRSPADFERPAHLMIKDMGLLCTILDNAEPTTVLREAAERFLSRAVSG